MIDPRVLAERGRVSFDPRKLGDIVYGPGGYDRLNRKLAQFAAQP